MVAYFLGIRIDIETRKHIKERVRKFLQDSYQRTVYTPNPEMLVLAHRDIHFKDILNSGDLNICDGFGIRLVSLFRSKEERPERISGIDFLEDICRIATEEDKTVFLLGSGKTGGPKLAKQTLEKKFSKLKIVGIDVGPKIQYTVGQPIQVDGNNEIFQKIQAVAPDILFVGFGHGKQEEWINQNLEKFPSVKIAMGVGGSFDFLAGTAKRAPKILRTIGFEWLWRLIQEPKRFKRIWTAVIVFPFLIFKNR